MNLKFTVKQCTANKEGKFVLKLVYLESTKVFGQMKDVKRTCYIGGMATAVAIDTVLEEDTNNLIFKTYSQAMIIQADGTALFMPIEAAIEQKLEYTHLDLTWIHVKTEIDRARERAALSGALKA
jgi:hypothetical protein